MANFDNTTGLTSKWDGILPAAHCIVNGYTALRVVNKIHKQAGKHMQAQTATYKTDYKAR